MIVSYFNEMENVLVSLYNLSKTCTNHPVILGNEREIFINCFLKNHLPEIISIGRKAQIIDTSCKGGKSNTHEFDIVLYRNTFPKLNLSGTSVIFLAESVIATIEIKSTLDKEGLKKAVEASLYSKNLKRHLSGVTLAGTLTPKSILNYVIAYDGPKIETINNWMREIYK